LGDDTGIEDGTMMIKTLFFAISILAGIGLSCLSAGLDREYTLVISEPDKSGFDVVQAGLNKSEAEGVAFQLNEIFKRRGIRVVVGARPQVDIGRYHPKPK
jgi:hypothetical protein